MTWVEVRRPAEGLSLETPVPAQGVDDCPASVPEFRGSRRSHLNHRVAGSVGDMQRFSSVILVDDRGWVLLQERDEFPVIDPEKWGFVGGHLDEGEDYLAGAYRELEEETGLRLDGGLELFGEFAVRHAGIPRATTSSGCS